MLGKKQPHRAHAFKKCYWCYTNGVKKESRRFLAMFNHKNTQKVLQKTRNFGAATLLGNRREEVENTYPNLTYWCNYAVRFHCNFLFMHPIELLLRHWKYCGQNYYTLQILNIRSWAWRKGQKFTFREGATVVQYSPWTFALVGGPVLKDGDLDPNRFSDDVIVFDQENYVWEARKEIHIGKISEN